MIEVLNFLNSRTTFRYTGIFRWEGDMVRTICLFDRNGEKVPSSPTGRLDDTLCQFVTETSNFITTESANDERLMGFENHGAIDSYVGLPLLREPGDIYGTLCHFDPEVRLISDSEILFLQAVAVLLMDYLK